MERLWSEAHSNLDKIDLKMMQTFDVIMSLSLQIDFHSQYGVSISISY